MYIPPTHLSPFSLLSLSLSLSLSFSLYILSSLSPWGGSVTCVNVCVCVCALWTKTHNRERVTHTHVLDIRIFPWKNDIPFWTPGIIQFSWQADRLFTSRSTKCEHAGAYVYDAKIFGNARERAIIGIIECTVTLVRPFFFSLVFFLFLLYLIKDVT